MGPCNPYKLITSIASSDLSGIGLKGVKSQISQVYEKFEQVIFEKAAISIGNGTFTGNGILCILLMFSEEAKSLTEGCCLHQWCVCVCLQQPMDGKEELIKKKRA